MAENNNNGAGGIRIQSRVGYLERRIAIGGAKMSRCMAAPATNAAALLSTSYGRVQGARVRTLVAPHRYKAQLHYRSILQKKKVQKTTHSKNFFPHQLDPSRKA